jgi:crotonobetainyl-CoA:carnitine CoA-transferase CaiB-like acyl-CoA transferase
VLQETFRGPSSNRLPYREFLDLFITELTSQLGVEEAYHEGQRRRIAFTPVQTAAALANDPHLAARGFFETFEVAPGQPLKWPGAPYRPSKTPCRILRRRPLSPEEEAAAGHEAGRAAEHAGKAAGRHGGSLLARAGQQPGGAGALAGLRVVELGTGLAGPWIGRIMAWCDAEVIKVESRAHPDVPRLYVSPREPERGVQPECSPWFTDWNAGKHFVALDLSKEEGAELCRRLIDRSDFVVANYGTGVLERLGLDYARLAERNPGLILLRSTGYGETGPFSRYATWGPNIEALSGLSRFSGFPHRDCTTTHFAYPDPLSALHGLVALLAALLHRDRGGSGQAIDLSQLETTIAAIGECLVESFATGEEPARLGNRELDRAPWGCFPCAGERRWVVITVEDDAEWARFVEILGRPDWACEARFATIAGRLEHVDELEARIAAWTRTQADYDVMDRCQRAGIAAGVVQNSEDLYRRDPQLAARGFFETIPHFKRGEVVACGIPLGLQGTPGRTTHTGSSVGHDNDLVFREVLGLSADEIEGFVKRGAIERGGPG